MKTTMVFHLLIVGGLASQTVSQQQIAARAMAKAIEQQRASVAVQRATARPGPPPLRAARLCDPIAPELAERIAGDAAQHFSVDKKLVRAVMQQESGLLPCAVSAKGAMGLMQLMPQTATAMGVIDAFDPQQNAAGGAKYLRALLDLFGGDVRLALAAYNAGPGRISQSAGVPSIPETKAYVEAIMRDLATTAAAR